MNTSVLLHQALKICSYCVLDTTVPGIRFDENGICHYCHSHNSMLQTHPRDERILVQKRFQLIETIKRKGKNKPYDCVVGVSGGTDSTYTLYLTKQFGLRPLAVHLDDGWDSTVAVTNIRHAVTKLNVDLETFVLNWDEIKDLQRAFLKASVPDPVVPSDVAIHGALYRTALKEGIGYILAGQSFMTEGTQPRPWSYMDGTYVLSVHQRFGEIPLKDYPNATIYQIAYYLFLKGIKQIPLLNYFHYNKQEARQVLAQELNWNYYGGHHYENIFCQFIQAYYNIKKFNIDRRKVTLSAAVRMGHLKREDALEELKNPPSLDPEVIAYCIRKLNFTEEEFENIMACPPKSFHDYPTSYPILKKLRFLIKLAVKAGFITPVLYEKYLT